LRQFWLRVTLWLLGYPEAALVDGRQALKQALEIGSAGTSMTALAWAPLVHIECGNYSTAKKEAEELAALANEKDATLWKAAAVLLQGFVLAPTGEASKAVQIITSGITAWRATGAMIWMPAWRRPDRLGACAQEADRHYAVVEPLPRVLDRELY
jgi:hypothetical protein